MQIIRRRGRPRHNRPFFDTGTPELVMKRVIGATAESLDLMLSRGNITPEQHWCGIHLRWLYTLRFGAPGVRAIDPLHFGGIENKVDDPHWRTLREQEYLTAIAYLKERHVADMLLGVCVFNERLPFMSTTTQTMTRLHAENNLRTLNKLLEGFDILVKLWCKKVKQHVL